MAIMRASVTVLLWCSGARGAPVSGVLSDAPCPAWCANFVCDGSGWCQDGKLPAPCQGCVLIPTRTTQTTPPKAETTPPQVETRPGTNTQAAVQAYVAPPGYTCPAEYTLCPANEQQPSAFCDLDVDCFGNLDDCRPDTVACPGQNGCCVVAAEKGGPPLLPPAPSPPPQMCPPEYHLCEPNEQQPFAFCDLDWDCYGNLNDCRAFTSACPAQKGCCVVQPIEAVFEPPTPPSPPAPLVPVCPEHMHLCSPNENQEEVFCDIDQDCYGDADICGSNPACPDMRTGCCVQEPTMQPQPDGWIPPYGFKDQLSTQVCEILFRDKSHLFRRMWGIDSRQQNHKGDEACWSRVRHAKWDHQPAEQYFEDILSGRYCQLTDWYEGSTTGHGFFGPDAPALLGFDADIHNFCGGDNCDGRGVNILMLFGHIKYNTCRNFEWQMCAVRGLLNSQGKKEIMFARAPNTMYIDGYPPLGRCSGWTDAPCDDYVGYANDDIYYIEVCLFSMVCKNSDALFQLEVGERWICDFDLEGFMSLQEMLLEGPLD